MPNNHSNKGVYWERSSNKWVARIFIDKKRVHLGRFNDQSVAIDAVRFAREFPPVRKHSHQNWESLVITRPGSVLAVPLFTKDELAAWALIDVTDLPIVRGLQWSISDSGYARRGKPAEYMSRLILGLPKGKRFIEADHINRDRLDNRRTNLRAVSHFENMQNRSGRAIFDPAANPDQVSIRFDWQSATKRWRVRLSVRGEVISIGRFADRSKAERAGRLAESIYNRLRKILSNQSTTHIL